jgi:hypothetical protein
LFPAGPLVTSVSRNAHSSPSAFSKWRSARRSPRTSCTATTSKRDTTSAIRRTSRKFRFGESSGRELPPLPRRQRARTQPRPVPQSRALVTLAEDTEASTRKGQGSLPARGRWRSLRRKDRGSPHRGRQAGRSTVRPRELHLPLSTTPRGRGAWADRPRRSELSLLRRPRPRSAAPLESRACALGRSSWSWRASLSSEPAWPLPSQHAGHLVIHTPPSRVGGESVRLASREKLCVTQPSTR